MERDIRTNSDNPTQGASDSKEGVNASPERASAASDGASLRKTEGVKEAVAAKSVNAEQLLAEGIVAAESRAKNRAYRRDRVLKLAQIAIDACYNAAEAGNMTCRNAVYKMEAIINGLDAD